MDYTNTATINQNADSINRTLIYKATNCRLFQQTGDV